MRIECEILIGKGTSVGKRPCRGFVLLGRTRLKGPSSSFAYHLKVSTAKERNAAPISLSTGNWSLISNHLSRGCVSVLCSAPTALSIYISKADPSRLAKFVHKLKLVLNGDDIDLIETGEVKSTEFRRTTRLVVTEREQYPKEGFPTTLERLQISGIDLRRIDGRWFTLRQLSELDLSRNSIGDAPNLRVLAGVSKLLNLKALNLSENKLSVIPMEVWTSLPTSLIHLDMSHNPLHRFPLEVFRLRSLQFLKLKNCQISVVPNEVVVLRQLTVLDLSDNNLEALPGSMRSMRQHLNELFASGNRFLTNLPPVKDSLCVPSLMEISSSTVANFRLDESILPRDLQQDLPFSRVICSRCMRYGSRSGMQISFRVESGSQLSRAASDSLRLVLRILLCPACCRRSS